ncbi:MAG: histidinol-phosphate transaminase [Candidatus Zixiibacteriota bacterium]
MIRIPPHIQSLQPYVAGKPIAELAREKNLSRIVKLASNENPLGPSPKALEAARLALLESHRYVDPGSYDLVHALAVKHHKPPQQIVCASGVDALLGYIIKAFSEDGDEVLTSEGTFIGIYVNTNKHRRRLCQVPLRQYHYDLDAILDAISPHTRIIYIANPNNPTGTIVTAAEFSQFMTRVPADILVVLDEAYYSYAATNPEYPRGLTLNHENLIVARTFSKDYGLAGLRLGFAVGAEYLIRELYKVKLPFEPNYIAQCAGIAALTDDEFIRKVVVLNERNLARMSFRLAELGIQQVHSDANFILMLMPTEQFAMDFNAACLERGLILRHVRSFGIPNGIRINSGTNEEISFALAVIEEVYAQLHGREHGRLPNTNKG